jgi:hypothetical protein
MTYAALEYRVNLVATGSNGMYLSVTCAEDLPWIKANEWLRTLSWVTIDCANSEKHARSGHAQRSSVTIRNPA